MVGSLSANKPATASLQQSVLEATMSLQQTVLEALADLRRPQMELIARLDREGDANSTNSGNSFSLAQMLPIAGAGLSAGVGVGSPAPGRATFIQSVSLWASSPVTGRFQVGSGGSAWGGTGTYPLEDYGFACGPAATQILPVNRFVRSGDRTGVGAYIDSFVDPTGIATGMGQITATTTNGSAVINGLVVPIASGLTITGPNIPAGTTVLSYSNGTATLSNPATASATSPHTLYGVRFKSGVKAWSLADSINFEAKKVILMLGDSTWNGTGPSSVLTCIPWLINKFYRDQGQDTRYILKAYSGSNSSGHENYRASGKYEFPQVDAIFYNLGINDAVQGVSTATRTANVQALIAWKQKRYPKAKLVIFGTTPVQDNTQEAAIAAFRAADAATVAAAADPLIKYCNLGGSFDRTVYGNFATSDPNGTAVHVRDQGLTPLWEGGYNGNAGLRAWLLANLPAI
jgi:lysophospholipase L1-like esterase